MTLLLALVLVVGSVGVLLGSAKPAGADTVFQTGQVFASVGNSTVNVYDPSSGNLLDSLVDNTDEPYTVDTAFNSQGDIFVADDVNGDISEFAPDGTPLPTFATGLSNPISMVFDNQGNMYVGQQTTPYIAEFAPDGTRLADIGPLQTELYGDDWIDLAADECTFYYTTEGTDILTYNKCTNTQGPNFNKVAFPSVDPTTGLSVNAFELKILADGDVLVADSNAVLLLDPNGNVIQTYPCSALPNCSGQLFALSVDPSGTSFWTADSASGAIYQINIATGALMQTIQTHEGLLFGLSVLGNLEVATPSQTTTTVPSALNIQPVTGNFSTPTPVSAVLTNPDTSAPIVNEPVTFTLNGNSSEACTADTDVTGTATCDITASEPSSSYTLTASFPGDTTTSEPIGSVSTSSTFTVTPDTSSLIYTGATTGVNGQPITLMGTLTTDAPSPGTPLPSKVVTFTVGSGSTAQSCNSVTDPNGDVSCTIPSLDQPQTSVTITSSFAGDVYDTQSTVPTRATVTEPTVLTVNSATSAYSNSTMVSAVLTDANTNAPIANEPVTLTLNGAETCTTSTNATGTASCPITPGEAGGTYTLSGTFGGDTTLPLQLTSSSGSAPVVVTLEGTALTYTGGTTAQNGQSLTVSGVLTSDEGNTSLWNQPVTFTLGSGSSTQTCTGTTTSTGSASCTIAVSGQPQGPIPVTDTFGGNAYYQQASASSTVNLPEGTTLTVSPGTGTYNGSSMLTGTLMNTDTNQPVPNASVTLKLNGSQTCTAATNASGVASCPVTATEPPGTYSLTGTFGGITSTTPVLLSSSGSSTFVESKAPSTLTYTGSTSTTSGQAPNLSATLTTAGGTPLSGQTVTFTVGTGSGAQHCSATTNTSGSASCNICSYNQSTSPLPVTVTYGGNTDYSSSTTSESVTVITPTTLSVSATTATYGQPVSLTGTLTNSVTGQGISGQTITLTLNATQTCTVATGSNGKGSCNVTPTEASGTYPVTGSFAGNTATSPQLAASNGSNKVVVNGAPTSIAYTGATSVTNGQSLTLSATLTSNGTALGNQPVTLALGTAQSEQSCTATTNSSGSASCTIESVNQVTGTVTVTVSYAGNTTYAASSSSASVKVSSCGGGGSGGSGGSGGCGGGGCGGGYCEPPPVGGGRSCC